jgi:LuxR family transcriptional regulator, maltose regulon positive regulatory protein
MSHVESPSTSDDPVLTVASAGIVSRRTLFRRLGGAARITQISGPAGSGKTVLLRSWAGEAGLSDRTAWVSVQADERDTERFWISVADALRQTAAGSLLVRSLTVAPDLDGWAVVDRLLEDLASVEGRLWLVVDDMHELRSADALRQFELFLMRAPAGLRFILSTRHDLRLGLHRLRLEGGLTELRAADLRFDADEARELFDAAGIYLPEAALAQLVARTEGWAAGLRLAALSLAGHPDPERFAAEFSGTERTVAEYLLAEVLEGQPDEMRWLLLRTSLLERVSGPLADYLTGSQGGERALQELEKANAFVTALDAGRSWFRFHSLFAELLRLELRRLQPGEVPALHAVAARWFAEHGYPVEATRHAQAAGNWALASSLLSDHWVSLLFDGQGATARELLAGFPPDVVTANPELSVLGAAEQLAVGSLDGAERRLTQAARTAASVPGDRQPHFRTLLAVARLSLARQRGDLPAAVKEAECLLTTEDGQDIPSPLVGEDLRALAMVNLGVAERFSYRIEEAERHLSQGVALARRAGRPYLEVDGLAAFAMVAAMGSSPLGPELATQAAELAERNGWDSEPVVAVAYLTLSANALWLGRLDDAVPWQERASRAIRAESQPGDALMLHYQRGVLELARGRNADALAAVEPIVRFTDQLVEHHLVAIKSRAIFVRALVRSGETTRAEAALADLDDVELHVGDMRCATAVLRLALGDPEGARAALAPVLGGSAVMLAPSASAIQPFLLEAAAQDMLGNDSSCATNVERALDMAERDGFVLPFLIDRVPALLKRHLERWTAHGFLASQILDLLSGNSGGVLGISEGQAGRGQGLFEHLSDSETRILRYLPTNLTAPEVAAELHVSVNTVRTHMRHLYDKLSAHSRGEAVRRARTLGLLASAAREG